MHVLANEIISIGTKSLCMKLFCIFYKQFDFFSIYCYEIFLWIQPWMIFWCWFISDYILLSNFPPRLVLCMMKAQSFMHEMHRSKDIHAIFYILYFYEFFFCGNMLDWEILRWELGGLVVKIFDIFKNFGIIVYENRKNFEVF